MCDEKKLQQSQNNLDPLDTYDIRDKVTCLADNRKQTSYHLFINEKLAYPLTTEISLLLAAFTIRNLAIKLSPKT